MRWLRSTSKSRQVAIAAAIAALLGCQEALAQAVAWKPAKSVEIISPVARGGGTDATARTIQRMLEKYGLLEVASSVVNKAGGGGEETWTYLGRFAGDGHYLAISTPPLLTNRITGASATSYTDVTPITNLFSEYVLIAVRADSPFMTGGDLAARLRRGASSVSIAFSNVPGNHNHVAPALVAKAVGGDAAKLRFEVFETGEKAAAAVLDGRMDAVSATAGTILKSARGGKLRLLGLTAPKRLGGALAGVPTWKEQGVDVVVATWRGVVGPRGMTPAQVAYWESVFLKLSFNDEWLAELSERGWDGTYLSSAETRRFLREQYTLMEGMLRELGLTR
jgi:putative tricarboxylic transport membrane protein